MAKETKSKFQSRSFVSFGVALTFLIMGISGIFLYFAPPGRIAHWSEWKFLGFTKEQWQALHTIFSFLFAIVAGFHIYYNWSALMSYLKRKAIKGIHRKRELAWSSVLTVVIFVMTAMGLPPFGTIMDWGEDLSNSWANEQTEPPIPHAELMSLEELAKLSGIDLQVVLNRLNKNGIVPDSSTVVVKDLAKKYGLTPNEIYEKMKIQQPQKEESENHVYGAGTGFGYGRMTVQQICEKNGVDVNLALQKLAEKNISAAADDNIRKLADEYNVMPVEVVKIITEK